jgi:hypothetical protein
LRPEEGSSVISASNGCGRPNRRWEATTRLYARWSPVMKLGLVDPGPTSPRSDADHDLARTIVIAPSGKLRATPCSARIP